MKNFLNAYDKFLNVITKAAGLIAGFLVLAIGFMVVYEVIVRGVFNAPTEWVMEISTYFLIVAGFFGMGTAYAGKKHIRVDIFISRLSPKTRCRLEILTSVAGIFYCYLFTTEAWKMAMLSLEMDNKAPTTLSTPLWIPQLALPVGMLILLLHIIRTLIYDINALRENSFDGEDAK